MTAETEDRKPPNPWMARWSVFSVLLVAVCIIAAVTISALTWWEQRTWERDVTVAACERPTSKDYRLSGVLPVQDWAPIGASLLPVTDFGPSREEDGAPVCYEQSPQGAAMAAVHIVTLGANGETSTVLEHMAADTDATRTMAEMVDTETVPSTPARAVAVRLEDYTVEEASVTVVASTAHGDLAQTVDLVWEDGDWKWDTPTESVPVSPVTNLSGYNTLGGTDG